MTFWVLSTGGSEGANYYAMYLAKLTVTIIIKSIRVGF